ncbi:enoyl-CoA hydratase/isomerase family protein [Sphingomonas sp. IC4-52]|uniref:enoyl-CoA hydratase/isomerase family protein n=1 Tax=Sphingomonas sp. IC4-52 TaxID=2887202 RepID=UPI001D10629D|nr:enoyl-CoA hydratase-related protein [Sphingomonas sp. IC4-52]MCC2980220.1 enoyl-CoA hydratase/isomerase family protein [Sphingomonas sp. IC4-52]
MISLDQDAGVVRLTMDRPERRNAMGTAHWLALADAVGCIPADAAVVLLRSAVPGTFSAGADLSEIAHLADSPEGRAPFRLALRAAADALAALPMPVVAAIEGGCHGAGFALALAADLRVASEAASFAIPPARLGIGYPAEDLGRLSALIGPGQAARLLFTAETIDAAEAVRIGLVEMIGSGDAVTKAIAGNDPGALVMLKAMLRDPGNPAHGRAFEDSFGSARFRSGTQRYR